MPSSEWFYVQDRQKVGPVSKEEIRSLFEQGTIAGEDLVWTQGMSEWKPASQVQARFAPPAARPAAPVAAPTPVPEIGAGLEPAIDMGAPPPAMDSPAKTRGYEVGEGLGIERNYAPTTEHEYAGFGQRVGAVIIDGIIVFVLTSIVMLICFGAMLFVGSLMANTAVGNGLLTILSIGTYVLMTATPWLYFARQESGMKMATIGKRVMGIQVLDTDGYPVSFLRATGRYFSKMISAIPCYTGFLFPLFTEKKQALHDMVAATLVVKAKV